jgi:hypothetical protein
MTMITIIGRGHSGTRAMSHTLSASGVFMGSPLNESGDLLPPEDMYEATRVLAKRVHWLGGLQWDWSELFSAEVDPGFSRLINSYLRTVLESPAEHKGWKIPETTLVFPWIIRLFPEIKYIFWIRNPRDCILGSHLTDDLTEWGVQYEPCEDERLRRAISWKYQYDLVKATPKPEQWIEVRFEDFILQQDETLERLEDFLRIKLAKIPVRSEAVDRWKLDEGISYYDFLEPGMIEYGYNGVTQSPTPERSPASAA